MPIIAFASLVLTKAAAVVVWFLGRYLNGKPGRRLVDQDTGEGVVIQAHHALFWIKMEYWAVALVGLAFAIPFL